MTDPQPHVSGSASRNQILFWIVPVYLIASLLWRLFTPAYEYPVRTAQVIEIGLDALMIAGLIAVRASIPKPLVVLALIAGIGLFGIRMTSTAAWWTGHLTYSLR